MNQQQISRVRKIIFLTMAILAVLSSFTRVRPALAQSTPANFDAVDEYITTKMKELGIPGATLVIVEGDQIVHLKSFGVADASGRPVTPQSPFFTGSTGKSFTALAIMQLVEADKIKLDDNAPASEIKFSSQRIFESLFDPVCFLTISKRLVNAVGDQIDLCNRAVHFDEWEQFHTAY